MSTLNLPFEAHARATDPRTSHDAAKKWNENKKRLSQACQDVLAYFIEHNEATDGELEKDKRLAALYPKPSTIRKRRCDLRDAELVVDTGRKRDGMVVWALNAVKLQEVVQ